MNRRTLLERTISALAGARILDSTGLGLLPPANASREERKQAALRIRTQAALSQSVRPPQSASANSDEIQLPGYVGCYRKGLERAQGGLVAPAAYEALLHAMNTGRFEDFELIPRAGGRRLSNPQSAFAFHLEGGDPHTFDIPAAPSITSKTILPDASELYWQAVCRDIPFAEYGTSSVIGRAAKHLGVAPEVLFRGTTRGDLHGPYVSQFLLRRIPYGPGWVDQQYKTPVEGSDFLTTSSEWSQIQAGFLPWRSATYRNFPRYVNTGRDLAEYVHYDFANQAFLGAALILINSNPKTILNCNQFKSANNPYRYSTVEDGFATFGPAETLDWLGRVTTAALKAAYCQKWMVHRRLRPEELGGLIHELGTGVSHPSIYPGLLEDAGVREVYRQHGTYFLPQCYPEGAPTHPSYPSGHAAIAGACAIVLKACFDYNMLLPACVEPSADGVSLQPCGDFSPTVGDEIDKLAFNVAMGRDWAGIHYRSDTVAGLKLGEDVAISILQDLARTFSESFSGFAFTRFSGAKVCVAPDGKLLEG